MVAATLAEIVRTTESAYRQRYGPDLLPSHHHALTAIKRCRTSALGGHLYHCDTCDTSHYQYHSCRNRHCPQCQHSVGQAWLETQQHRLLNSHYFMLTFTLPEALRTLARVNQKAVYTAMFRCAAAATQLLAQDERFIGGQIGMMGVLHTWGRNLSYHPHIHFLVPGGGLTTTMGWRATPHNFFLPVRALSRIYKAKLRDTLQAGGLTDKVPHQVWTGDWVVHCQPVGKGTHALRYLAPYIFRVALSNRRILRFANDTVTFRYRESDTGKWRTCKLQAQEFLRRFLQHVLPKGFVKVRYYGLFSPALRNKLNHCQAFLTGMVDEKAAHTDSNTDGATRYMPTCRACGNELRCVRRFEPRLRSPPSV